MGSPRYRSSVQFLGHPNPLVESTKNVDTAVRHARDAFTAGAFLATVVRVDNDEVIYDGPLGIERR